jgi:hypothetical protein
MSKKTNKKVIPVTLVPTVLNTKENKRLKKAVAAELQKSGEEKDMAELLRAEAEKEEEGENEDTAEHDGSRSDGSN